MTIHPMQDAAAEGQSTAYDTLWSGQGVPTQESVGLERVMLAHDKLYVVLAVVLIIWLGIAVFIARTDRKIARLERRIDERIAQSEPDL